MGLDGAGEVRKSKGGRPSTVTEGGATSCRAWEVDAKWRVCVVFVTPEHDTMSHASTSNENQTLEGWSVRKVLFVPRQVRVKVVGLQRV